MGVGVGVGDRGGVVMERRRELGKLCSFLASCLSRKGVSFLQVFTLKISCLR